LRDGLCDRARKSGDSGFVHRIALFIDMDMVSNWLGLLPALQSQRQQQAGSKP